MGMFDKPKYLTGEDGFVEPGDEFYLHNGRLDGTVNVNGKERPQAKLLVSRELDSEKVTVFTSGAGVVAQIQRMSREDRDALPMKIRLDEIPSNHGNPTRVLTPANMPPASASGSNNNPPDF